MGTQKLSSRIYRKEGSSLDDLDRNRSMICMVKAGESCLLQSPFSMSDGRAGRNSAGDFSDR